MVGNKTPAGEDVCDKLETLTEENPTSNHDKSYIIPPPTSSPLPRLTKPPANYNELFDDTESMYRYKNILMKEAEQFIKETAFNDFVSEISKEVIGQDNLELVLAGVFSYITGIAKTGKPPKINMLLTAPSGTGKTETFRALRMYFKKKIPSFVISQVDVTHITTEGFKGKDTSEIVLDLIEKSTGGYDIIFMDEFDKRISPQHAVEGGDVGQEVQNQILTLIEGSTEVYTSKTVNKTETIDSNLTMFIGCGSFNAVREKKKKSANKTLGFIKQNSGYDIYDDITREDILEAGCSYEMLGRFPLIINYHKLEKEAIKIIIEKLIHKIRRDLGFLDLIVDDGYIQNMINMANGEFGCRLLYSSIFQSSMYAYKEVLKKGISSKVIVKLGRDSLEIYKGDQELSEKENEF
jgi:ATP-dependent protease Clp ATPase subunit